MKSNTSTGKNNHSGTTNVNSDNAPNAGLQTKSSAAALISSSKKQYQKNSNSASRISETPFEKLFLDLLKDTLGAEKSIVEVMPKVIDAATADNLKDAFEEHLSATQKQVLRLEHVFKLLGKTAESVTCEAMEALIKETKKVLEQTPEGSMTRDAGLIICAQKIEHYEIAAYGSLVQVALTLNHDEIASILEKTLNEEEEADLLLTEIAETDINPMADEEGEEAEEAVTEEEQGKR